MSSERYNGHEGRESLSVMAHQYSFQRRHIKALPPCLPSAATVSPPYESSTEQRCVWPTRTICSLLLGPASQIASVINFGTHAFCHYNGRASYARLACSILFHSVLPFDFGHGICETTSFRHVERMPCITCISENYDATMKHPVQIDLIHDNQQHTNTCYDR